MIGGELQALPSESKNGDFFFTEIPLPMMKVMLEHAEIVIEKMYRMYEKEIGPKHINTITAKESLERIKPQ